MVCFLVTVGVGFGIVAVVAVTVIYFVMSNANLMPPCTHDEDDDYTDIDPNGFMGNMDNGSQLHLHHAGDKCTLCLKEMTNETMRTMNCGHALHNSCFDEYRELRRFCPYCEQFVLRLDLPGDACAICCEPMKKDTMEYLKCEHALHTKCLSEYKRNYYRKCPVCARQL
ncbi:uncharacterized protein LOC133837742 [Drosophila sulfurigaster albostrigata]|uniref:uncharacterized protein LOC133837742 n=1 Tax=Drosophila sulfurigaster albostrigata TaxID=89887 RepID=UPI002D21CD8C|nr:uncharacterized protein LOC133837742 [Drosophila sulfurigaster albostrigata]